MEQKNKLIPELRFPEFVKDGEWEENSISFFGEIVTGSTPSKEESIYWGGDFVWITAQDFKGKNIFDSKLKLTEKGKSKSRIIPKDSVLITCIASIGLNGINKVDCATNQQINAIVCNPFNYYEFVYYAISNSVHRLKSLAGQTAVPIISKSVFEKFIIQNPKKLQEQQKIADCLSSLDEVITAHSEKLEALQNHKKGLLQNLFPQENQKVPNYRFPEFVNDGEWEEKELNELGELINGLTYSPNDVQEEGLLVLRSSNIQNGLIDLKDCVYVRKDIKGANISQSNDILVCVRNGSKALIGKNALIPENLPLATHGAFMTVFRAKNPHFVFQLFQTIFYETQVNGDLGATINSINGKNFLKYKFPFPKNPKEQKKIADCLMAVDDLITAATEKIEQLKAHKKGLMQGLFP